MKNGKKFIPLLGVIPFILGFLGYYKAGVPITNALYGAFTLYFSSPSAEGYNGFIEAARWTAPATTITTFTYLLQSAWEKLMWFVKSRTKDSIAVYAETDFSIADYVDKSVIYAGKKIIPKAKSQILLFKTDRENIEFYEANKEQLQNKNVYIGIREIELGFFRDSKAVFFDINGTIARLLWKEIKIWTFGKNKISVVIYGDSVLGQSILSAGLLINLFHVDQQVDYTFITDCHSYERKHKDMELWNADRICYFSKKDGAADEALESADVVIVADEVSLDVLQMICVCARGKDVYYYAPNKNPISVLLQMESLHPFGKNEQIFSDGNIRLEKMLADAKELHQKYKEKHAGTENWENLSGFLKWSNISAADYLDVMKQLKPGLGDEMLAKLEHIRWSRFYTLNYWSYGTPKDGKNRDETLKIHKCLVRYDELTQEEKEKNRDVVKQMYT